MSEMRARGYSISEIARKTSLPVSTVWNHTHGIPVLPQYRERIERRKRMSTENAIKRRDQSFALASQLVPQLDARTLAAAVAMLYWAHGSKVDCSFTAADPEMLGLYIVGLTTAYNVKPEDIEFIVRSPKGRGVSAVSFWEMELGLRKGSVSRCYERGSRGRSRNECGSLTVRVRRGGLLRQTFHGISRRVLRLATDAAVTAKDNPL